MNKKLIAVVIITNGPGELSTWVKPVVDQLNKIKSSYHKDNRPHFSLRLVLVPCPNANGKEYEVAESWNQFELITKAKIFWKLLINPYLHSHWPKNGIVVFLGGDQLWSVLLALRLGYINIIYAEWMARWPRWNNIIAVMNKDIQASIPKIYRQKSQIVGDLMADVQDSKKINLNRKEKNWIALLPGSKKAKLSVGVPYFLEVADYIAKKNKDISFMIPLAPTTNINDYLFFQSDKNPLSKYYSSKIKIIKKIKNSHFEYFIETSNNTKLYLIKKHPCHEILKNCDLAITTVGANTAELAALTLPMLVVLPTQHLNVMNAWDGLFGIIGKISIINRLLIFIMKKWYFRNKKFFSWPNIQAKKLIVPERIGNISPKQISTEVLYLIKNKKYLKQQKDNLLKQRGNRGAVKKFAHLIFNSIKKLS